MSDHEVLKKYKSKITKDKISDMDDFAGMMVNAGKSINVRELIVIWLWFIILHSEPFILKILSKFSGTVDEKNNMTMKGTGYISIIMILGVIIIDMIYR
jgi:hypothetical protein